MAILYQKDVTTTTTGQTITTTTETAVQTSNNVPFEFGTAKVNIQTSVGITPGTNATSVTLRIYRGATIAGTLVLASIAFTCVAGQPIVYTLGATDSISGLGTAQYTVSVQQGAATGNATVGEVSLEVEVLSG